MPERILALLYVIGAPVAAWLEFDRQLMSQRFGLPAGFIYAVSGIQVVLALALLKPRLVVPALAGLTFIALGAVASHLAIGSPLTALPAFAFAAFQVWLIKARSGPPR